jgi:hypothetical protein
MGQWSIEVGSWKRLKRDRQREFLRLVGEAGGEWWGEGHFVLPAYPQAHRLGTTARARGFYVRIGPSEDVLSQA